MFKTGDYISIIPNSDFVTKNTWKKGTVAKILYKRNGLYNIIWCTYNNVERKYKKTAIDSNFRLSTKTEIILYGGK